MNTIVDEELTMNQLRDLLDTEKYKICKIWMQRSSLKSGDSSLNLHNGQQGAAALAVYGCLWLLLSDW